MPPYEPERKAILPKPRSVKKANPYEFLIGNGNTEEQKSQMGHLAEPPRWRGLGIPCVRDGESAENSRKTLNSMKTSKLQKSMRTRRFLVAAAVAVVLTVSLATPKPAEAFIHEIIAALCRAGGEEVIPPGQVKDGQSFTRALLATGFITSVDTSDPTKVVISFDPTVPASKFKSAGFDLTIPDGIAPGVDLVLSPFVVVDEAFAAHLNCHNLNE